jgi:hypothetical protein
VTLENLLLVERLTRQQRAGEQVELLAVRAQQAPGFVVALADDPAHLGIDGFRRRLAERLLARVSAEPPRYGFSRGASCTSPIFSLMPSA